MRTPIVLLVVLGCGTEPEEAPPPPPMPICTATLPAGAKASSGRDDKAASAACTEATTAIVDAPASSIVPDGYQALGDAVEFKMASPPTFPHGVDLVIPADLARGPAGAPTGRIVIVGKRRDGLTAVVPAVNLVYEAPWKRIHFHALELGTYQAAIPKNAAEKRKRRYAFRAIGGASMGGMGSSLNVWLRPERYDGISVFGADPGPSMVYTMGMMYDWFFGGFCTAEDQAAGRGKIGQTCPSPRKAMRDQFELGFDFEHLPFQKGEGIGLTPKRGFWFRAFRDVFRAFGNGLYASAPGDTSPYALYLPPGVPKSYLELPNAEACAKPVVLKSFYDWRYNPDGRYPAITFCDGNDSPTKGFGAFDPTLAQDVPTQIFLAVDVNGNGKRDAGEPVITQPTERFWDWGEDGVPSEMEPGYDAESNPDPARDDFHWYWNPKGKERNWRWDEGEKYDDFGVDGVKGKGCEVGSSPGCYDFGEGNGTFDYTAGMQRILSRDPHSNIEKYPDEVIDRIDLYYDAGIRDFLNNAVSTNTLMGHMQSRGRHVRVWDGFPAMIGLHHSQETRVDPAQVDLASLGQRIYVRYGDPDTADGLVEMTGDGRHVGSVLQAVHRGQMMFYALSNMWPGGDKNTDVGDPGTQTNGKFTAKNGRVTDYTIVTPPGYNDPEYAEVRYPIVYLLHGLGMKPMDLANMAIIANSAMVNNNIPVARRMQKMIIVVPDGACRPGGELRDGPIPTMGDKCEEGAYYSDHPDGTYLGETHILELQEQLEGKYRVKAPEEHTVVQ